MLAARTFNEICDEVRVLGRRSGGRAGDLDVARLVPWPASAETSCQSGYYRLASGDCAHRPVCGVSSPPQGATALCNDGCYSFSENADMDETCTRHGGTKKVLN